MKSRCKWIAIASVSLLFGVTTAQGQVPSTVMTLRSITKAMTMSYRLFTPAGYDRAKKYPLILAFHGYNQDGPDESNTGYIDYNSLCSFWVSNALQAAHPCFVVAPHNPSGTWIDTIFTVCNASGTYHQGPLSARLSTVMSILDSLQKEFSIDTNRIYVTGLSIGGFATWDLITRFPGRFAAAIPMSGAADTTKAAAVAGLPIWCCHGQIDDVVTPLSDRYMMAAIDRLDGSNGVVYTECNGTVCVTTSKTKLDSLVNAGVLHLYTEVKNVAHAIWDNCYANTSIQTWLFKQVKAAVAVTPGGRRAGSCLSRPAKVMVVPGDRAGLRSILRSGGRLYDVRGSLVSHAALGQVSVQVPRMLIVGH
jgi:predicted peptidase